MFNATQAREASSSSSPAASFFAFFLRCAVAPGWAHADFQLLPPALPHSFLRPAAALFTLRPVVHCTRDAPCTVPMEDNDHCRLLRRLEGVSFSRCLLSVDTSVSLPPTRVEYQGAVRGSFVLSVGGRLVLSLSLPEPVLPPTKIQLFSGSTPIPHFAIVEAGRTFTITVAVDASAGVRLQLTPPLPDSVFVNTTTITGVLDRPLNTTFTLTAANAAGQATTALRLLVERTADTYLRCDAGRVRVVVAEEKGFSGTLAAGEAVPVYTREGFVPVTAACYALEGCRLSLHHFDEGVLPLLTLHYQQEVSTMLALPVVGFAVTPMVVEAAAFLHHPVPTLFWSVDGFCRTSFASLPAWLRPSSAVSLDGVAEEPGAFVFSATLANSTHAVALVFLVTVEDELLLPSNATLLTLRTQLAPDDDFMQTVPLFAAANDTLTVAYVTLPYLAFSAITQQVLLSPGFHNITLPSSDHTRIDVLLHSLPIATRLPSQPRLWFLVQETVRPEELLLRFPPWGEQPGAWTDPGYDDGIWDPAEPGELAFDTETPFLFRKHFLLDARRASAIGVSLTLRSGALVFLNGELVWRVHVAPGCAKGCEPVAVDSFAAPRHFEMTLMRRLRADDNVLAVQLVPFAHHTHPLFLTLALFPIAAPVVVSTPATPITASFSVVPVRPPTPSHF